jgi:hypothetical protein
MWWTYGYILPFQVFLNIEIDVFLYKFGIKTTAKIIDVVVWNISVFSDSSIQTS